MAVRAVAYRLCPLTAAVLILMVMVPTGARALQVGGYPTGQTVESAVRSEIGQPSRFVNGTNAHAYWDSVNFPDGWFIQTGYFDASNGDSGDCQSGFSTFTTVLYNGTFVSGYGTYNTTHCGLTGAHSFKIAISGGGDSYIQWRTYLSGNAIGPAVDPPRRDSSFTRIETAAASETVCASNCDFNSSTPFPTVDYAPTSQFQGSSGDPWEDADHADAVIAGPDYNCNWFTELVIADNDLATGNASNLPSTPCYSLGDPLW